MIDLIIPVRENLELRILNRSDAPAFFEVIRKNDGYLRK